MIEPNEIKFSIIVIEEPKFFRYAISTIHKLVTRGNVAPKDIVFSVAPEFLGEEVDKLADMGVQILPTLASLNKPGCIDRIFKMYPTCQSVVQVDSDIYLNQTHDLYAFAKKHQTKDFAAYLNTIFKASDVFDVRTAKYPQENTFGSKQYGFVDPARRRCLGRLVKEIYGEDLESMMVWLYKQPWPHGGIVIYNRSILSKIGWDMLLKWSEFSRQEETGIVLAMKSDPSIEWEVLTHEDIIHWFSNENMWAIDKAKQIGFIHYAGDWFRNGTQDKEVLELTQEGQDWIRSYVKH